MEADRDEKECGALLEQGQKRIVPVWRSNVPIGQSIDRSTEMKIVMKMELPRIESDIILAPFHSLFPSTDQALCFLVKGFCNDRLFAFRVTVTQNARGHG